ncbi:DHA2 family efflux MFS transporter permease subunit [bacterium]|nr:DHA2 family efflux MFS transporter permease subunit [bacterium]
MTQAVAENEWKPSKSPWLIAIPTIFAAFMFVLDETIANVALPHMAGTFSVSRQESMWILTSYIVASGIMITAVDWFCKKLGRKNFFIGSICLFTVSSFMCGISNSIEMILIARILQGLGGGGLLPVAQAVMLEGFEPQERGKAMASFGLVIVVAPIIGPVLGGWITDNWNWPWIFFINVPIGIFTMWISKVLLEDPPYAQKQENVRLDKIGFLFLVLWLVSMQVIFDKGNDADWFNAPWICKLTIFCVLCFIAFIVSQLKGKSPLIDLTVFKDKNYAIGTWVQVAIMAIMLASIALLPQFLQTLLGYSAFTSGMAIMPRGCGALLGIAIFGSLSKKVDNRLFALFGLLLVGIAGLKFGFLNLNISTISIAIPNFMFGVGMGFAMMPLVAYSVMTLDNSQMTNASGLQNMLKNVGGAVGTSVVTTLISRYSQIHQANMVGNMTNLNQVFADKVSSMTAVFSQLTSIDVANYMAQYSLYGSMLKQATLWGFMEAFRWCGIVAIIIAPLVFLLKNPKK